MKKQYTIKVNTEILTRKSGNTYTHVVVGIGLNAVYLLGYAGSLKLAQARAKGWEARSGNFGRVEIIEITPDMVREIQPRGAKKVAKLLNDFEESSLKKGVDYSDRFGDES